MVLQSEWSGGRMGLVTVDIAVARGAHDFYVVVYKHAVMD